MHTNYFWFASIFTKTSYPKNAFKFLKTCLEWTILGHVSHDISTYWDLNSQRELRERERKRKRETRGEREKYREREKERDERGERKIYGERERGEKKESERERERKGTDFQQVDIKSYLKKQCLEQSIL